MKFAEFANFLNRLEGTSSRNEMTVILSELFGQLKKHEAREVTYLLSGTLGPAYRSPNFGVADKMMLRALGEEAEKVFKQKGDMGLVAEELHTRRTETELDCDEVYKKMWEIAMTGGEGSQEKKLELIRELLTHFDANSAKYAVRIVLGKLRTGFSDMTVLDALSWMIGQNKKLKPAIEAMYNVRADLGEIAEEIVEKRKPVDVEPELGTPVLMARAERASSAEEIWERNGKCIAEYKLDGLRIQAHVYPSPTSALKQGERNFSDDSKRVVLYSRGLENVTSMYPDVVEALAKHIKKEAIIEGEMIGLDSKGDFLPFQETAQRKRKYGIEEMSGKIPLSIFLFDILYVDGKSVMDKPNFERRKLLEDVVENLTDKTHVRLIERVDINSALDIEKFFDEALTAGTEGIIAKRSDGPYQAGARDFNWIKYKESYDKSALADTIDAVVMGYDVGQGKRSAFGIGDFLIGVYDEKTEKYFTVAKIGTGLTDEEWRKMKKLIDENKSDKQPEEFEVNKIMNVDVWSNPKIVVEIQADEITKSPMHTSGYALRFPRLVSWREKKPTDSTSKKEILRLFEIQKA